MKVLLDMNMSPLWIEFLRSAGIDAAHWSQLGHAAEADENIMDFAAKQRWIVLTLDLDFGILLARSGNALPSVIQLRTDDVLPAQIGKRIASTLTQLEAQLVDGALVTINLARTRVSVLPLRADD